MRTHRILMAFAVLALTAADLAAVSPAAMAATGQITVSGSILAGNTAAGSAAVQLVAQPPVSLSSQLRVGQRLNWTPVASTVAASDGTFTAQIDLAALRPFANPGGIVNMDAIAWTRHAITLYGFSVSITQRTPVSTGDMTLRASSQSFPSSRQAPSVCGPPVLLQVYGPQWAKVGQTSIIITGGETQEFTYIRSQRSNLGVGVAVNGWSESGTYNISTTDTIPYGVFGDNATKLYQTKFRYALYGEAKCPEFTQPYDYYGGAQILNVTPVEAQQCVRYAAGTSPIFDTQTAATFSAGIPVPAIPITLTAQTGWSQDGSITYTMGPNSHDICGASGPPGDNPGWLVVGLS